MAVAGKVAITLSNENDGKWSSSVTYERLTAVTHNNNLYISKKPSANVEPTVTDEFWFLALEGFSGEDIEKIISGETPVGNANLLEGLTAEQVGASGARNLIPYPYYETTHTEDGITWVDNGDGTVTANGTATAESVFYLQIKFILPAGTYSLSGCPSGGGGTLYSIQIADNAWVNHFADFGNGRTFSTTEEVNFAQFRLRVGSGTTVENLIFKPMLELGSVAHDYVPYHFGGAEDAKTVNGFAVYTDVSQLGLSATATLLEVYNAMPYLSELECNSSVLTDASWNFPSAAGTVKIVKINTIRGYLEFRQKLGLSFYWMGLDNSSPSLPDGVWHNIGDGGNAKTLDGHGAEYFLPIDGIADSAKSISVYGGNEVNFKGFTGGTGLFFNFRDGNTNQANTKALDWIRFGSGLANGTDAVQIDMTKGKGTLRDVFHTGNKPTGTYTGNGDATQRIIETGGTGEFALIKYGNTGFALLTSGGYISSNGTAVICGSDAYFASSKIILSTTNVIFNESGSTYKWQVL